MGANVDEERVVANAVTTDEKDEKKDGETPPNGAKTATEAEKEPEPTFDKGFKSWLQVFGSFFLFFNSWHVRYNQRLDLVSTC